MKRGLHTASFAFAAISLLVGLLIVTGEGQGAEGFADLEKQVKEFQLDNGLTFLVLERSEVPVFSFRTYVDVGGSDEVTGITGIAHMFEHMAFKGTRYIGTNDYDAEVGALVAVDKAWHELLDERRKGFMAESTTDSTMMLLTKASSRSASLVSCVSGASLSRCDPASTFSFRRFTAESRCLMAAMAACSKLINIVVISASISRAEDPNVSLICNLASNKASLANSTYRWGPTSVAYQKM